MHYVSGRTQNSRGCTSCTMSVVGHKTAEVVPHTLCQWKDKKQQRLYLIHYVSGRTKQQRLYLVHYVSGRTQNSRGCTLYTMSVVGHKTAEVVPCTLCQW